MRLGQRFESARRLSVFPAKPIKIEEPTIMLQRVLAAVGQQ
jgi:hypothetical protein